MRERYRSVAGGRGSQKINFNQMKVVTFLLSFLVSILSSRIICRDPDLGGQHPPEQIFHRQFMTFGCEECSGAGFGNLMIFFPAVYYFAALTGRDLLIFDNSILGELCKIITCGFPMVSEMSLAYPSLLGPDKLRGIKKVKALDFHKHFDGSRPLHEPLLRGDGYMPASDWWVSYNRTAHCIRKLTGCKLGDVSCAERHAFQRLVRGPFRSQLTPQEESRLEGVPKHIKHALLSLPHAFAPRLDLAVHLRTQFNHFEKQSDINDPSYRREVDDWLNSTEGLRVFDDIEEMIVYELQQTVLANRAAARARGGIELDSPGLQDNDPIYIYLASDNEEVKDAFALRLLKKHKELNLNIMRIETKFVVHAKDLKTLKDETKNEGLLDLFFDWYALSLSNIIVAWRRNTNMVSTFVHSAQRVSGNTEVTNTSAPVGHGIGTRGMQLSYARGGRTKWGQMWVYSLLDEMVPDKDEIVFWD